MWKSCYTEAYPSLSKEIFEKCTGAMNIQYYGDFCFKISTKPAGRATEDIVIWTDPLQKGAGLRSPQGQVDLIFLTYRDTEEGKARGQNTVFIFESEGIHLCYLGALGHDITPELLDKLSGVDIVFIPVGGGDTTSAKLAAELVRKIEPSIVIPMHYKIPGLTLSLETEKAFCDALGNCPAQALPKLNIKQKDLEGKKMEVVILERGV